MTAALLLILATILNTPNATHKSITFSVIQKDSKVGEIQGIKSTIDDKIIYTCLTNATPKKIVKIKIASAYEVQMEKGKMKVADANITVRGNAYAQNHTEYCEENCLTEDDPNTHFISKAISFTSTMMFFEEPINISQVYSEIDGSFHHLKNLGNHTYEKTNPKGEKSLFYYNNGNLDHAELDMGFFSVKIIRK